jgi:hypothetical protein
MRSHSYPFTYNGSDIIRYKFRCLRSNHHAANTPPLHADYRDCSGFLHGLIIFYGDQFSPLASNTFRKLLLSGKQVVGPINRSIIRVGAVSRKIPFVDNISVRIWGGGNVPMLIFVSVTAPCGSRSSL